MDRCVNAGISGALLSLFINLFSPVNLYFIPSFLAAVLFIYVSRLQTSREGLVTSLMTSVLSDGILNTLVATTFYVTGEPYTLTIDIGIVISFILSAIFAVLAGYIGVRLVGRVKPTQEMPQPQMPPTSIPPV